MPLSQNDANKLLGKIEKFQAENGIKWNSVAEKERRIVYIPFTADQDIAKDGKQTLRETKEEERKALMLRSFAKAMQNIMDKRDPQAAADRMKTALGANGKLDAQNLMRVFEAIEDDNVKADILRKTAAKTPIIIQRGKSLPAGFQINENDSIEIAAHGRHNEDLIQNADTKMNAQEVLEHMQQDFGDQMQNIRKIKLTSCGSGSAFFNSFIAEAAAESYNLAGDTTVDGYNGEAFMIPKIEHALDHLDKGNRFISSAGDLKFLRDLKGMRSAVDVTIEVIGQEKADWSVANDPEAGLEFVESEESEGVAEKPESEEMKRDKETFNAKIKIFDTEQELYQASKGSLTQDIEDHTFNSQKFTRASLPDSRKREAIKTVRDSLTSSSSSSNSASPRHGTGESSSSNAAPSPALSPPSSSSSSQRQKMG